MCWKMAREAVKKCTHTYTSKQIYKDTDTAAHTPTHSCKAGKKIRLRLRLRLRDSDSDIDRNGYTHVVIHICCKDSAGGRT